MGQKQIKRYRRAIRKEVKKRASELREMDFEELRDMPFRDRLGFFIEFGAYMFGPRGRRKVV